jgi:hypothetical protein
MMSGRMNIREHMPIVGSDGHHVGTVDRLDGEWIKLSRGDVAAGGVHHWLPLSVVASCNDGQVQLACTAQLARDSWQAGDIHGPGSPGLASPRQGEADQPAMGAEQNLHIGGAAAAGPGHPGHGHGQGDDEGAQMREQRLDPPGRRPDQPLPR